MESTVCAFCGTSAPAASMDMTGHGWRCVSCTARSELDKARTGGGNEMAEHLTPQELQGIVRAGRTEGFSGLGLSVLGVVLTIASFATGGSVVVLFSGLTFGGLAMAGHGFHRSRKAAAALAQMPSARVVS